MRSLWRCLLDVAILACLCSIQPQAEATAIARRSSETGVVVYSPPIKKTSFSVTDLSVRPVPDASEPSVVVGLIALNGVIYGGLCVAAGAVSAGVGLGVCIAAGIGALIASYGLAYITGTVTLKERADHLGTIAYIHEQWAATPNCSVACQVKSNAPRDTWTALGNTTSADGVHTHDIYFIHSTSYAGLRAISTSHTIQKRQDIDVFTEDEDNSVITDYFFDNESETAWDDWGSFSNSADSLGDQISDFLVTNDGTIICMDFEDGDGFVDSGVVTIGVDNTPNEPPVDTMADYLLDCNDL